jgi:hypothetical protein
MSFRARLLRPHYEGRVGTTIEADTLGTIGWPVSEKGMITLHFETPIRIVGPTKHFGKLIKGIRVYGYQIRVLQFQNFENIQ